MAKESFRDILASFLDGETAESPSETHESPRRMAASAPETPFFQWQSTTINTKPLGKFYPAPERKAPPVAKVKPAVVEPKWAISELNAVEQQQVKKLVQMGATEINGEISLSQLKKAHRRLAKQLHPDVQNQPSASPKQQSQEGFLALQSIYECLSEALLEKARAARAPSAEACGSESASAEASRRPNAA